MVYIVLTMDIMCNGSNENIDKSISSAQIGSQQHFYITCKYSHSLSYEHST
jgi:hypothetical protein